MKFDAGENNERKGEARHLCLKAGRSDIPVLICGETGTGKELAAHRIHEESRRGQGPFLGINCAALSETLLESELFGHVKGAFTGASRDRQGKFAAASGGTLFLDEIAEMTVTSQAKILRVLEEKKVAPLGSEKAVRADTRIIAATNTHPPTNPLSETQSRPEKDNRLLKDEDRMRYLDALQATKYPGTERWNVSSAARQLGIPRETLVYHLKKLRLFR